MIKKSCLEIDQEDMFETDCTMTSHFPLVLGSGETITLGQILINTPVFCPRHEMVDIDLHHPSAVVFVDPGTETRKIYCSVCTPLYGGALIKEYVEPFGYTDIKSMCDNVIIINERFLMVEHLLPAHPEPDDGHEVFILSEVGTGKSTAFQQLKKVHDYKSILCVTPQINVAMYLSTLFELGYYNQIIKNTTTKPVFNVEQQFLNTHEKANIRLDNTPQLAICLNSIPRILKRSEPYEIIVLDEAHAIAQQAIASITKPDLGAISFALNDLLKKAKRTLAMSADLDIPTMRVLYSDCDFNDPKKFTIRINESNSVLADTRVLIAYIICMWEAGENIFIGSNQCEFTKYLVSTSF
jgi:hypothetical protein